MHYTIHIKSVFKYTFSKLVFIYFFLFEQFPYTYNLIRKR